MPALLYLPRGAVSEEGGSVGRGRHQGGGAARGVSSTTWKERAKTPRLRGSRSSGQSPFHASAPPQPPPPPNQGHMPLLAHHLHWGTHFPPRLQTFHSRVWLVKRTVAGMCWNSLSLCPTTCWSELYPLGSPGTACHPVSQRLLRDSKTVTLGPSSLLQVVHPFCYSSSRDQGVWFPPPASLMYFK